MSYKLIIYLLFLPALGFSQQKTCSTDIEPIYKLDWAQSLIDNPINKIECFLGKNTENSNQGYYSLFQYVRDDSTNSVWGTFNNRWGEMIGQTYYSFDEQNRIDTILFFNNNRSKLLSQSYFTYDASGLLKEKKMVRYRGKTITHKYFTKKSKKGTIKEEIILSDSLVFRSSKSYSLDGKLLSEASNDFRHSINQKTYFSYQNNGDCIREIHIKDKDSIFTRIINKSGYDSETKLVIEGDTILEQSSTFSPQNNVQKTEFFEADKETKIVKCYFNKEMKLNKKVIETISIHNPEKIEILYNQFGLPKSELRYSNGVYLSSRHFEYQID